MAWLPAARSPADGHVFGVPLEALSLRWPPLLAEVQELLLAHISTADDLSAALHLASHASTQQRLDAVCSAIDGAHGAAGIGAALNAVRDYPSQVAAVGLGALLRLLSRLPEPAVPCELYPLVLSAGPGSVAPLLRKRVPAGQASFLDAICSLFGQLLLRCNFDDGLTPSTVEHESALHALLFVLTPALLRPAPDAPLPLAERTAATRAVRAMMSYHLQRQRFRALGSGGAGSSSGGVSPSHEARTQSAGASTLPPADAPTPPPTATGLPQGSPLLRPQSARSEPSSTPTPTQGRSRGGALAMSAVASAITQMFEREVQALDFAGRSRMLMFMPPTLCTSHLAHPDALT